MARDTKERILDVAARLFEAQGFEGTAVAAILREAGVNSGSLYHFFPNKEGLLVSVLERHRETLDRLLDDAARAAGNPLERVFALLELYRGRLIVSGFARGCPVGDLALEVASRHHEARVLCEDYFAAWTERVSAWLEEAGHPAGATDQTAVARHVLSAMEGAVLQARIMSSIEPFDDSIAQLRVLLGRLEDAGRPGSRPTSRLRPAPRPSRSADPGPAAAPASPERAESEARRDAGVPAEEPAGWKAW